MKAQSNANQSGAGINVSKDGKEVTLLWSRDSKYKDKKNDKMLIFEAQRPKVETTTVLTKYRNNKKLIKSIVDGTIDIKKLKYLKNCFQMDGFPLI